MKTIWNQVVLCTALLVTSLPAIAARPATEQTSLEAVRNRLRANGCDRFIVVQAFMDGFLKENEPYTLSYTGDKVMINDVPLAEPFRTSYISMITSFFVEHPIGGNTRISSYKVTSDETNLSSSKILEPDYAAASCPCRKEEQKTIVIIKRPESAAAPAATTKTAATNTDPDRRIIYSVDGITVDGRKLSASEEQQYKQLYFNSVTPAPVGKETRVVTGNAR